jgi:predicted small integral membrane protein
MKWTEMLGALLLNPREVWRGGTPGRPKKGLMNKSTVKGDKLSRAVSRSGSVYGRKTWL